MKITASREAYRCKICTVTEEEARGADGFSINRCIVRHRGSAVMLAVDVRRRVLLVRHSYGPPVWALPGGGLGRNEDPGVAAAREFREELGCGLADVLALKARRFWSEKR